MSPLSCDNSKTMTDTTKIIITVITTAILLGGWLISDIRENRADIRAIRADMREDRAQAKADSSKTIAPLSAPLTAPAAPAA